MFNSLKAQPLHNPLLTTIVNLFLLFHISGEHNLVADVLSHSLFNIIQYHAPALPIYHFTPPQLMLGAVQQ